MKHIAIILGLLISLICMIFVPQAQAKGLGNIPIGGKVLSTIAGVTCASETTSPYIIQPAGKTSMGLNVIVSPSAKRYKNYTVGVGSWFLGKYEFDPSTCYTDTTPPVDYPTYALTKFGSSTK